MQGIDGILTITYLYGEWDDAMLCQASKYGCDGLWRVLPPVFACGASFDVQKTKLEI
jgi:hypothetical protein